jgi:hypothetical protein
VWRDTVTNLFIDGDVALIVYVPEEQVAPVGGELALLRVGAGYPTVVKKENN